MQHVRQKLNHAWCNESSPLSSNRRSLTRKFSGVGWVKMFEEEEWLKHSETGRWETSNKQTDLLFCAWERALTELVERSWDEPLCFVVSASLFIAFPVIFCPHALLLQKMITIHAPTHQTLNKVDHDDMLFFVFFTKSSSFKCPTSHRRIHLPSSSSTALCPENISTPLKLQFLFSEGPPSLLVKACKSQISALVPAWISVVWCHSWPLKPRRSS